MGLLLLAAAAVLLAVGAGLFADHAVGAGRMIGARGVALALLVAGAEPDELAAALTASVRGEPDIAWGLAVGANITLLGLILGLVTLARPVRVDGRVRRYAAAAAGLGATAAAFATSGGALTRPEGAALVGCYLVGALVVWRLERNPPLIGEIGSALLDNEEIEAEGAGRAVVVAASGLAMTLGGGWLAVVGAQWMVEDRGLEGSVAGLTLVALATNMDHLALIGASGRRRLGDLTAAALVGSTAYNATMTLGAAAMLHPIPAGSTLPAGWLVPLLPVVALFLGAPGRIPRWGGLVLVGLYLAFVLTLLL